MPIEFMKRVTLEDISHLLSGSMKHVTTEDIQQVENLIGQCLKKYLCPKEIVETLLNESKIEPEFTEIVWNKLNEQNAEFFKAYYTRLVLKSQIEQYNKLLEKQKELIDSQQTEAASVPTSNGFHHHVAPLPSNSNGSHISPGDENSKSNSHQEREDDDNIINPNI